MTQALPGPPFLGERKNCFLRAIFKSSVLPTPQDAHPGSPKCRRPRCITCPHHLVEGPTLTSQQTNGTIHNRHKLRCTTSIIIYMIYSSKCIHLQYVGETGGTLKQRFYLHRSKNKTNKNVRPLITEHFTLPNHSLLDLRCVPIGKSFTDNTLK